MSFSHTHTDRRDVCVVAPLAEFQFGTGLGWFRFREGREGREEREEKERKKGREGREGR